MEDLKRMLKCMAVGFGLFLGSCSLFVVPMLIARIFTKSWPMCEMIGTLSLAATLLFGLLYETGKNFLDS